jgi:hypothetical protein
MGVGSAGRLRARPSCQPSDHWRPDQQRQGQRPAQCQAEAAPLLQGNPIAAAPRSQ